MCVSSSPCQRNQQKKSDRYEQKQNYQNSRKALEERKCTKRHGIKSNFRIIIILLEHGSDLYPTLDCYRE
jgi:hypothetical protein